MKSESNPETANSGTNGTVNYTYDSISPCGDGSNYSYPGNLVQKKDNAGSYTCYAYDGLHRVLKEGNSSATNTILREFVYDSETSYPTGVSVSNGKTHMVEAKTINTSNLSVNVTDEFFSYSVRGELTDVYESTPHSGGYYHTTASYWPTGALETLSGIPGVPTIYYGASNGAGLDGEGRYTQVTASGTGATPITNVTYSTTSTTDPLGALTGVTFGSADSDSFAYDPNTGRMTGYTFSVNSKTDAGTLTWNSNGTLNQLAITDQLNSSDTQTCNYLYDDLQRSSSVNCGSTWTQYFTYDTFGNITKSGSLSFLPTYSATQNQFTSIPGVSVKYDADGNLLTDNLNSYTWDPNWGNMLTVTPAGSATVTATYDALGRMVENNAGGTYTEIIYGPTGKKLATANGQTLIKAFIALPGGAKAIYNSSGLAYYRHSDWLGSSRLTSTASRTVYSSTAYAPFGEQYANSGTADASFTGQDQDTVTSLYDFPARRYSPSQGRWISPDPLGRGAVTLTNPQSWNRYAYVNNNPLALIDAMGLSVRHHKRSHAMLLIDCPLQDADDDCNDDNSGGDDDNSGGDDDNSGDPGNNCDADCQIQQAEQNALDALSNPDCARVVDGNTGAASTALLQSINPSIGTDPGNPLYGSTDPIATITTGDLGPNTTVTNADGSTTITGTAAQTTPTPNDEMVNGVWTNLGMTSPSTITLNSNANGGFLNQGGFMGYSNQFAQAITILHELGHAAAYAGLPGNIQPDVGSGGTGDPAVLEIQDLYNSQQIADNCFPTGD